MYGWALSYRSIRTHVVSDEDMQTEISFLPICIEFAHEMDDSRYLSMLSYYDE